MRPLPGVQAPPRGRRSGGWQANANRIRLPWKIRTASMSLAGLNPVPRGVAHPGRPVAQDRYQAFPGSDASRPLDDQRRADPIPPVPGAADPPDKPSAVTAPSTASRRPTANRADPILGTTTL